MPLNARVVHILASLALLISSASRAQAYDETSTWQGAQTDSSPLVYLEPKPGFMPVLNARQCVAPLPLIGWMGFKHTWLEIGGKTYGMPYSFFGSAVAGGPAPIQSPDPMVQQMVSKQECRPIYQPNGDSPSAFTSRLRCIADKLSDAPSEFTDNWMPIYRYSWSDTNCHSAVRFILDCAGGAMSIFPNGGLGSEYEPSLPAYIWSQESNQAYFSEISSVVQQFHFILGKISRGDWKEGGFHDIRSFLKSPISVHLSDEARLVIYKIARSKDEKKLALYWQLEKFVNLYWQIVSYLPPGRFPHEKIRQLWDLDQLLKKPEIVQSTYEKICQRAQSECQ